MANVPAPQKDIKTGKRVELRCQSLKPSRDEKVGRIPCFVVMTHGSYPTHLRRWEPGQGHRSGFGMEMGAAASHLVFSYFNSKKLLSLPRTHDSNESNTAAMRKIKYGSIQECACCLGRLGAT